MSMNVGAIMKALLGDSKPADARALELKIGQIVRGVMMEMLDNDEALLQINGTPVRARLDTPLPLGKGTLLQVQPQSSEGTVVLKPLPDATGAPGEEPMQGVAKSFGMPDQDWSLELLKGLKRDGYPIDRDAARWFKTASEAKPPGIPAQEWMNAAGVAYRRGLEPTEATISSLRQALYGPPVDEQLAQLRSLLDEFVGGSGAGAASDAAKQAVGRLATLLARGDELLREGSEALVAPTSGEAETGETIDEGGTAARTLPSSPGARGEIGDGATSAGGREAQPMSSAERNAAANGPSPSAAGAQAGTSPATSAADEASARGVPGPGSPAADGGTAARAAPPEAQRLSAAGGELAKAVEDAPASAANANAELARGQAGGRPDSAWIGRFLQWLGVEHERQLLHSPGDRTGVQEGGGDPTLDPAAGDEGRAGESLKSALLTLASSDELPAPLREAAQSLAGHITGQQLLLSTERQNLALMSHMTLFVPMKGPDGDTTATIHVQTRRGKKGEWDAGNCRLLFDLKMSHMGDTIVDVHVVDKTVSLRLLNDRPWVGELVEAARDEAAAGLREAGYQLSSLKTVPFPVRTHAEPAGDGANAVTASLIDEFGFAAKPYKGVDYRA